MNTPFHGIFDRGESSATGEIQDKPINQSGFDDFLNGKNQLFCYDLAQVGANRCQKFHVASRVDGKTMLQATKSVKKRHSTNPWDTLTSRYECRELIGMGGTSNVYRAIDQGMGREVALKRFLPGMGPDASRSEYEWESRIIKRLNHPNIVTTYDMGHDNEGHFIVMQLIHGKTLSQVFEGKMMRLAPFHSLALQCIDGLTAIHAAGVLDLDIKPTNIMVSKIGSHRLHAHIIDFGSAKLMLGNEIESRIQHDHSLHGSIFYMSPEQFNEEQLDERADIYAMGCMFYELLTGRQAFQGDNAVQIMAAHLKHDFIPLKKIRPDLPDDIVEVIHSMMEKDRVNRPESAIKIDEALEDIRCDLY